MCGFRWHAANGDEHTCARKHRQSTEIVQHQCECGATIHPKRRHPADHAQKVSEYTRALQAATLPARQTNKRWTPKEDEYIARSVAKHVPVKVMARKLNRSAYAVRARVRALAVGGTKKAIRHLLLAHDPEGM